MIWKEAHIKLKANREYCHNMSTTGNCVIVINRDTIVRIGLSPGSYERIIKPGNIGVLVRPFPLKQAYITSETDTNIKLIETKEDKIVEHFLQQDEKTINTNIVSTVGLKPFDLNLDTNRNVGVNIQNIPLVDVIYTPALKPFDLNLDTNRNVGVNVVNKPGIDQSDVYSILSDTQSSTNAALTVTLDTTSLCRTIVNVYVESNIAANFNILVSNDNITFRTKHTIALAQAGNMLYTINNNAYRYVKVETAELGNHVIEITATR